MIETIEIVGKGTDGLIHVAHRTRVLEPLCEWKPPLEKFHIHTGVGIKPTCLKCLEILSAETATPDPALAVIAAARAVLADVATAIVVDKTQGAKYLRVEAHIFGEVFVERFYEGDSTDTFLGRLAGLQAAIDEYDDPYEEHVKMSSSTE